MHSPIRALLTRERRPRHRADPARSFRTGQTRQEARRDAPGVSPFLSLRLRDAPWSMIHPKTLGVSFAMNCPDARESLSMLLDGDIGLTERVPLELHVNACAECRQKLADLQMFRDVPQKPAPRPVHWRPLLAAGLVGRAFEAIRPDDVATWLRRLVTERIPPRHLVLAAAVPLVLTLAVFVFERGFTVGVAMRQRAPSAPAAMRNSPPAPTASTESAIPHQSPPTAAAPAEPASSPAKAAPAVVAPSRITPPAEKAKVAETKALGTKAIDATGITRSSKPESGAKQDSKQDSKQDKVTPAVAPKPATTKSPSVSASPAVSTSTRGETATKSLPAVRPVPPKPGVAAAVSAPVAPVNSRRSVDVVGRLQVKSRSQAERDLTALFARTGGTTVSRQRGPTVTVVEAAIPRANYGKFAQELVRIGSWRVEAERSPLPDLVQVTVRLGE